MDFGICGGRKTRRAEQTDERLYVQEIRVRKEWPREEEGEPEKRGERADRKKEEGAGMGKHVYELRVWQNLEGEHSNGY